MKPVRLVIGVGAGIGEIPAEEGSATPRCNNVSMIWRWGNLSCEHCSFPFKYANIVFIVFLMKNR